MDIKRIFVAGAGQMGAGIAQVAAQNGFQTVVYDISEAILNHSLENIKKLLQKRVKNGRLSPQEYDQIFKSISLTTDLQTVAETDVVIEAIPEDEELKKKFLSAVDELVPSHTVLATNTSGISITRLASATRRPEKVIGMHFINPVPVMRLVEIVTGNLTSTETVEIVEKLAGDLGKEVIKAKDFPGFLSTRLIMPLMNEALYAVYESRGTVEDVDKCAKLAFNHPMGPFEWMDFVGLDTVLAILQDLYVAYGDRRYFPCPLLQQMVHAGNLGRKNGRGFYNYPGI